MPLPVTLPSATSFCPPVPPSRLSWLAHCPDPAIHAVILKRKALFFCFWEYLKGFHLLPKPLGACQLHRPSHMVGWPGIRVPALHPCPQLPATAFLGINPLMNKGGGAQGTVGLKGHHTHHCSEHVLLS